MQSNAIESRKYLNSMGVATKLANSTVGAWHRDPSKAIAIPHSRTVTPEDDKISPFKKF